MLSADGKLWVVKFQNRVHDLRMLANEFLAARLAQAVGLSVPQADVVEVPALLAAGLLQEKDMGLFYEPSGCYLPGQHFGSAFEGGLMPGLVVDYLSDKHLEKVRNLDEFRGMLAFDKWTGNFDGRQAVFQRTPRERRYRAMFIDHGFCFNGGQWNFPDRPLLGVYARDQVYAGVKGWSSFEPWLSRIEGFDAEALFRLAEAVPRSWYGGDTSLMMQLMERLLDRRKHVRDLIADFRDSPRQPSLCGLLSAVDADVVVITRGWY